VLIATNRGPVEFHRTPDGKLTTRRGPGGVITALATLGEHFPLTWVAATMTDGDREAFPDATSPARTIILGKQPLRVRYVPVSPELHRQHYDEVRNRILWFLQHYLWDPANRPDFKESHYRYWNEGYRVVNERIAQAIADEARAGTPGGFQAHDGKGTTVLLQDYHLYLAPRMVRERLPGAIVLQFVHIPWPAVRYWEFLPEPFLLDIFQGLAANDVLGFQTARDARNFLACAAEFLSGSRVDYPRGVLEWQGHQLAARAYPIPIDAAEVRRSLQSTAGRRGDRELREAGLIGDGRKLIVRVDRLDPTKNIVRGFEAYELLLEQHPELQGQVRLQAFLVPSREGLGPYRTYRRRVHQLIARINDRFGMDSWQPVAAFFENNRPRALAAMRQYDVLLVNPVIDGMNLVAKEGPAVNERDGVLVLTRTAGAYAQLHDAALPATATDLKELAQRLNEALEMPQEERAGRAAAARAIVEAETPREWVATQLHDAQTIHQIKRRLPQRRSSAAEQGPLPVG
jgi:trehalose 6-phosphate synthase